MQTALGLCGTVKYIGYNPQNLDHTHAEAHITSSMNPFSNQIVGLEMDEWNPNGNDGKLGTHKLFISTPKHGYFLTQETIINSKFVKSKITEGCQARLTGLQKDPQFNGTIVKVFQYVYERGRWSVQPVGRKRHYFGANDRNLEPVLDWVSSKNKHYTSNNNDRVTLKRVPYVGEIVRCKNDFVGIVRYIGETAFGMRDNKNIKPFWIGLELIDDNVDGFGGTDGGGSDGSIVNGNGNGNDKFLNCHSGLGYFDCVKPNRGYFVTLEQLSENISSFKWEQVRLIWIAFCNNKKNNLCLMNKLPKDIVKFLETFCRFNDKKELIEWEMKMGYINIIDNNCNEEKTDMDMDTQETKSLRLKLKQVKKDKDFPWKPIVIAQTYFQVFVWAYPRFQIAVELGLYFPQLIKWVYSNKAEIRRTIECYDAQRDAKNASNDLDPLFVAAVTGNTDIIECALQAGVCIMCYMNRWNMFVCVFVF